MTKTSITEETIISPIVTESVAPILALSPTSIVTDSPKEDSARGVEAIDYDIYSKIILEQTSNRIRGGTI